MMDPRLVNLARIRNEKIDDIVRRWSPKALELIPNSFSKHIPALINEKKIKVSGVDQGLAWVKLEDGMTFYSPITHPALRKQYNFVQDLMPESVTEDTFLAAIDVVQRYITDFTWPPNEVLRPSRDMRIIELGAYLGHKTLRFAKELASEGGGRVFAVEMMKENCDVLQKNIKANGLENIVEVLNVGVWNERKKIVGYSKGRQRNSIIPIDKLEDGDRVEFHADTLDGIIEKTKSDRIDLIFMTVNGVEREALSGFSKINHVESFFIAAPYKGESPDGTNSSLCRDRLSEIGYDLIDVGNDNRVVAKRKRKDPS